MPELFDHDGKPVPHYMTRVNGIRTHYITAGSGPPLLLLYGTLKNHYYWYRILPYCHGATHRNLCARRTAALSKRLGREVETSRGSHIHILVRSGLIRTGQFGLSLNRLSRSTRVDPSVSHRDTYLTPYFSVVAPDLRGFGATDKRYGDIKRLTCMLCTIRHSILGGLASNVQFAFVVDPLRVALGGIRGNGNVVV